MAYENMKKEALEKLRRIQELTEHIDKLQRELESLVMPEKVVAPPIGFSQSEEILRIVRNAGSPGISRSAILIELKKGFPQLSFDRKQVASALAYLKNSKREIESIARGFYRAAENQEKQKTSPEVGVE
ncbi:MAG: hypothetical protein HGB34_01010 [Candidatus Moranbacteria bacterium]|nr:hypothetical protein [Candidatus Moranbacteria bacterium]